MPWNSCQAQRTGPLLRRDRARLPAPLPEPSLKEPASFAAGAVSALGLEFGPAHVEFVIAASGPREGWPASLRSGDGEIGNHAKIVGDDDRHSGIGLKLVQELEDLRLNRDVQRRCGSSAIRSLGFVASAMAIITR